MTRTLPYAWIGILCWAQASCPSVVAFLSNLVTNRPGLRPFKPLFADRGTDGQHVLAILTMPTTSRDRIANEAILEQALQRCSKLSVVLRSADSLDNTHSLASLRRYVGEVYSALWDSAMGSESVKDVIVYPQNLPNAAPEQWIVNRPELDCICSHDSICGWVSSSAGGRGVLFQEEGETTIQNSLN